MKHTLLFLFLLFLGTSLQAQVSVSVDPNPWQGTLPTDLSDDWAEVIAHATFTNEDAATQSFRWLISVQNAPAEWQFRICDKNACYSTSTITNYDPNGFQEPVVLASGENSLLDLHILPKGVSGEGLIHVELSTIDDINTVIETAVYQVTIENSVATFERLSSQHIKVYPNPTTEHITLSDSRDVDQIVIYNMIGRQVRTFQVAANRNYSLADLPKGLYLVSLVNRQKGVLRTLRLQKLDKVGP